MVVVPFAKQEDIRMHIVQEAKQAKDLELKAGSSGPCKWQRECNFHTYIPYGERSCCVMTALAVCLRK